MNLANRFQYKRWLLIGAVVVMFAVPFFMSSEERDRPPTLEEFYWVGQTYYYHLTVQKLDWSNPDWQLIPAWENPQLGRCIIGFGLQLDGLSVTNLDWLGLYYHIIYKGWGVGRERDLRQAVVDRMQPAVRDMVLNHDSFAYPVENVTAGRAVMLLFGVLSVLLVFVLVSFYANQLVAFLMALLFSLHPAVVAAYTHLGVDILAIAFSLLVILHFEWIHRSVWRRFSRPKLCQMLIVLTGGLSLAFAVGSKLNAVIVGFLGAGLCLLYAIACVRQSSKEYLTQFNTTLFLLLISLFVFVASNPLHYPHPVSALWKEYAVSQRVMEIQEQVLPGALKTLGERISTIAAIVAVYPVGFILIMAAFLLEMGASWKKREMPSIIVLWWILALIVVAAWLPFARPLHVLPVIAPSIILLGAAAGWLIRMQTRSKIIPVEHMLNQSP